MIAGLDNHQQEKKQEAPVNTVQQPTGSNPVVN